jgi:hypothetical protein
VSPDGDALITTGRFLNSVQVLDPDSGAVLRDFRTLAVPLNAIRLGDALAVAQLAAGNVVDALSGAELLGGLSYPLGLATDGHTLYVSDWASGVVWAVSGGSAEQLATDLSAPEGLAVDGSRLLVVEEGLDRVAAIDLATGAVTPVIEGLDLGSRVTPGALPHGIFNGVTVGPTVRSTSPTTAPTPCTSSNAERQSPAAADSLGSKGAVAFDQTPQPQMWKTGYWSLSRVTRYVKS